MKRQQSTLFNIMDKTDQGVVSIPVDCDAQNTPKKTVPIKMAAKDSMSAIYASLVSGLKKYFGKHHFKRAVMGLSGGVDSSLTLKIAVDSLGAENITALLMPELGVTNHTNMDHAKVLCEYFGVEYFYQPINNLLLDFKVLQWKPHNLAIMNTKARLRAVLLYSYANTYDALVLGTSNKSELLLGYGTKYGDLAADIEVIGDLYKTEVVKLANFVGLPPEIANKTPSAELDLGQTDEKDLGASYADLDKILMRAAELGEKGCIEHGLPLDIVQNVFGRIGKNKHKTSLPHIIKIR